MPVAPPEIGPYRIVRPLGRGGMGAVYLAYDSRLGREVALKLFSGPEARSAAAREELLREARAAASLNHAHIASVHDVLDVDGQVGIVFEYVHGETLAKRIHRGRLSGAETISIAMQLAEALAAAHQQGIIHRDLKPANIAVTSDGMVKVLDFGVAHTLPESPQNPSAARTTASYFVGTVGYAAPEQCVGQSVDARADLFSLGVVMFEMLTGERPFAGSHVTSVLRAMVKGDAPLVSSKAADVPKDLDTLIARLLTADPALRPVSAREVLQELQGLAPTAARALPQIRPKRRHWIAATLGVAAIITTGLVGPLWSPRTTAPVTASTTPVIAVMPLTNASGDPAKDYLVVGVADSLVTRLASLPSVAVLSRTAVADARRTTKDVPALAAALDASFIVDGSVQQIGDTIRITLTLMQPNGTVVWADTAEGSFNSIFALQTQVASSLTQALSVQLSAAERASLARQPTMNRQALESYWRGRALLERRDVSGNVDAALAAFDQAIVHDPRFADAYAGRGEALWTRYVESKDQRAAQEAIAAGTTALRLNPARPMVRYSLALSLAGSGRLDEAVDELQHALALRPNYDDARRELGNVLARQGRTDAAIVELRKAIALRPNYWANYSALGLRMLEAGRYDEAADAFQRVIDLQPDNYIGHSQLGAVTQTLGRDDEALRHYQRANEIQPSARALANIGTIYYRRGQFAQAVDAYRESIALRPNIGATHGNLGDALQRMNRVAEARAAYREALRLAEATLKINPNDIDSLVATALYSAKAGDAAQAKRRVAAAEQLAVNDQEQLVRIAMTYALTDAREQALSILEGVVARGYSRSFIAEADEFASLRSSARFKTLVSGAPVSGGTPR